MKKFFTLIAAVLFAGSMMADDITCAAAVAAGNALADNTTDSTATVSVVGYVSITEAWKSDSKQQIFYMADDSASTSKAFEAYYCNTEVAIKRGDKVRVTGYLTKYVNKDGSFTQIEIKNGDAEILQAAPEEGPKEIQLYTVSEAIAAYDNGTLIEGDSCKVVGVISKWYAKSSKFDQYHSVSYFITDGVKEFEMYNSYSIDKANFETYDYTDENTATCVDVNGLQLNIGDSVIGIGTIKKYNDTYEFNQNCYLVWTNAAGGVAPAEEADVKFEATDFAGLGKAATQTEPGGDVLLVKEGVTFHCDNAYGTDTYGVRCYKNGNLTISADTIIGKIVFDLYGTYTGGLEPEVIVNDTVWNYTLPSQARMTTISIYFGEVEIPEVEVLSVAEALAIGALMDSTQVSDKLIIEGYVTQIDDNSFATQYKNMTFWIADEKGTAATNAEGALEIYRGKPDVELVVGDKVRVEGTIVNFKESVIETKSGAAVTKIAEEGIENIVLTEKAQKVMVDGVMYIVRDNKMYNAMGTQVR